MAYKSHVFRFGAAYNHLHGGGYAEFLGLAPAVGSPSLISGTKCALRNSGNCPFAGGNGNPLNYPADNVTFGNGQGFSSEKPAFGFPGGGLGPDNRIAFYFGDAWKVKPNFTLTYGSATCVILAGLIAISARSPLLINLIISSKKPGGAG